MYARPAIGGLMCMRYIVWIRVPSIMANFHKGITLVDENRGLHLFTRSRTITSKPSLVRKSKIWWGRVNCKFLLVGWRYIGFQKFQAMSLYYFNKLQKPLTLIASSFFWKIWQFFWYQKFGKKKRKKKGSLTMMTLILPMSWNLKTLVKEMALVPLKARASIFILITYMAQLALLDG